MMKRSSSAPMIPDLVDRPPPTAPVSSLQRRRGLTGSNVSLPDFARPPELSPRRQPLSSPLPMSRINSPTSRQHRVEQLKKEEAIDERRIEKEVQERILLSQSWDELKLESDDIGSELMEVLPPQIPPSFSYQSFISPSSPLTRMRSRSLTPTSPNSTRTFTYRRSCSPVLRPSTLSLLGKRKRDPDLEEMDTSPTVSCKRLQLDYASPSNNLSPSVSPLTGNSPLHHSFATSRKSSSQSESTPLSSPSSLNHTNPFAVNYDSGNCEHWQSGGSTGSSRGQSPLGNISLKADPRTVSLEEAKYAIHSPGIIISEDHRGMLDTSEICSEAPTPLSPKGLQFRHKPFPLATTTLPSPIPRSVHTSSATGHMNINTPRSSPVQIPKHSLHHDKHLSPFSSGAEVPYPLGHSHMHPRHIRQKGRSHLSTSSLGTARQMSKPEPLRPPPLDHRALQNSTRLGISSPLSRLSVGTMSCTGVEDSSGGTGTASSSVDQRVRLARKRRESETSNDSREDSFMESDNSLVSSLEESLDILCDSSGKDFSEPKVATTVS